MYNTDQIFNGYSNGDSMSILELIENAKAAPVTASQVEELRVRLENEDKAQSSNPSTVTKTFLARTYSL